MARQKDIRAHIAPIIEELIRLYEQSDPRSGLQSEIDKLQMAQDAYNQFWELYGHVMFWAQSQIMGYEQAKDNEQALQVLMTLKYPDSLHPGSHELELLGLMNMSNSPPMGDKLEKSFQLISDQLESGISDAALRESILKMLLSKNDVSLKWRQKLSYALGAVNHGQKPNFFIPTVKYRRGRPYDLDQTKALIISHVKYLEAKGFKSYIALEKIASSVCVSPETIRSWEKQLQSSDWFTFLWDSARIAGKYEELLDSDNENEDDEGDMALAEEFEMYGPFANVELAFEFLRYKDRLFYSLETLSENLRKYS